MIKHENTFEAKSHALRVNKSKVCTEQIKHTSVAPVWPGLNKAHLMHRIISQSISLTIFDRSPAPWPTPRIPLFLHLGWKVEPNLSMPIEYEIRWHANQVTHPSPVPIGASSSQLWRGTSQVAAWVPLSQPCDQMGEFHRKIWTSAPAKDWNHIIHKFKVIIRGHPDIAYQEA